MNRWVDGLMGNWNVAMTGRVENGRLFNINDVHLVNMTLNDLQKEFKYYRNPSDGFWYDLPQNLINNTIKAFSTDATSPTGYTVCNSSGSNAATCGGPDQTQPYIAPPNSASCFVVRQGDCSSARDQFFTSPIFTRFDFTAKKRFPFARHGSFDVEIDILNVFNDQDELPGHVRLQRREQHGRPGRPYRPARVPRELVSAGLGSSHTHTRLGFFTEAQPVFLTRPSRGPRCGGGCEYSDGGKCGRRTGTDVRDGFLSGGSATASPNSEGAGRNGG
jgi:hypothetical protein